MPSALTGLGVLAAAYILGVLAFSFAGLPLGASVFLGGSYALSALAALLFARGLLDFLIGVQREAVFFRAMRKITDPLIALTAPITPGFLAPFAEALYAAFLFYVLKLILFGDPALGLPPLIFFALFLLN